MNENKIAPYKLDKFIILEIINEDQTKEIYKCHENTILKDNLSNFAKKINKQIDSLFFLHSGNVITNENINQSIIKIMNTQDKNDSKITILAYKNNMDTDDSEQKIRIILVSETNETVNIIGNKDRPLKEILKSFVKEKGLDFNKMIFKYEDKEIDINKNYDDFANSEEKKYSRLILYYYVRSPKSPITINFIHKKFSKYEECFLEDKIRDIVNKYCSENQMNINNLVFKHGNIPINLDNNFFYLNSKEPNKGDETSSNFSMNKNQKILEIMVIDKIKDDSKIPLKNILIIIGIIIVIIIVMIIIITVPKKKWRKK